MSQPINASALDDRARSELAYCPELATLAASRRTVGRSGKVFNDMAALSTLNNLFVLRRLMEALKPERTLEIGLAFGASALVFTASHRERGGIPARQHVAIDPFQTSVWDYCGLDVIDRAGLAPYFDFRPGPSAQELAELQRTRAGFGLVYVDGSHLVEDVFVDAYFVARLLTEGGVVVFDDSTNRHVAKVLRFLRTNWRGGLKELDLAPYRGPGRRTDLYRIARALGRVQLTAFQRVGRVEREWDAPFVAF